MALVNKVEKNAFGTYGSVERYYATISESSRSGIKPARSTPPAVVVHAAAATCHTVT